MEKPSSQELFRLAEGLIFKAEYDSVLKTLVKGAGTAAELLDRSPVKEKFTAISSQLDLESVGAPGSSSASTLGTPGQRSPPLMRRRRRARTLSSSTAPAS